MQPHDGPPRSSPGQTPDHHWGLANGTAVPDMHELSVQVAKVRVKARPWKSIIALILAVAAAATSGWAHGHFIHFFSSVDGISQIIAAATAVAFCVFASIATIGLSGKARSVLQPVMGVSYAAIVQYALVLVGAVTTLLVTLVLFNVPVGQLLLGGALTSVFVGIAAQQALSNVFAGLVLLLSRPFRVGDAIRLRAGALSGEIDGTVTEIGITYLRLNCADGLISIPNSQVLNAVVGPLPAGEYPEPPPPAPPAVWPPAVPEPAASPVTDPAAPVPVSPAGSPPGAVRPSQEGSAGGSAAGPVGTADGAGGAPRPGANGEQ